MARTVRTLQSITIFNSVKFTLNFINQTYTQENKSLPFYYSDADAAFSAGNTEVARSVVAKIKYYNNVYEKVREYEREHGILD